ncbi:MAG: 16S rRNA (cytosine(1402)-N(4))-methyltransferase RsmH [Candidatus Magasanikbacteria bacterium]
MHIPVLLEEVKEILAPQPGEVVVDGTLGEGGHAKEFIKAIHPNGTFIGLDLNEQNLSKAKEELKKLKKKKSLEVQLHFFQKNFKNTEELIEKEDLKKPNIFFLDLGLCSSQIGSNKGFSYKKDEPLVMRYDEDVSGFTAARLLNEYSEKQLAEIIKEYGEEKFANRIAHEIAKKRREESLRTTGQLKEAIKKALPQNYSPDKHPAMRTFQAVRIFVNKELKNLKKILKKIPDFIAPSGKVGIISYHSLEDKIVKNKFLGLTEESTAEFLKELKKPSKKEKENNPRSRSAKFRAIKL